MRIDKIISRRADGSARVRYRADAGKDPATGKKRRKQFETRGEAKTWLESREKLPEAPAVGSKRDLKWLGEQFVADRKKVGRERSTYEKYDEHFKQHLNIIVFEHTDDDPPADEVFDGRLFGDLPVAELRSRHFVKLKTAIVSTRSHAMALRIWSTLAAAIDHGVAIEEVSANIVRSIKIDRKARETAELVEIPTKPDLAVLMAAVKPEQGEPIYIGQAMIALTLTSGLRPSEMRALPWSAVNIDTAPYHLTVAERVDQWRVAGAPKSAAGYRDIPLPESTARLLREWRLKCPKVGDLGLVFPTSAGTHWNLSNIHNRIWNPLQVALGLREKRLGADGQQLVDEKGNALWQGRYTWYALRHAYASIQIDLGMSPKKLQERMGHASVKMTMDLYGHLWKDRDTDAKDMVAMDVWLKTLPTER